MAKHSRSQVAGMSPAGGAAGLKKPAKEHIMLKFIAALFARRPRPEPEDLQLELTIETAIEMSQEKNEYVSISFRNGNVYAYPYGFGGTAWGVNGGKYGFSIIQGIRGGPEGNKRWINRDM